MTAPTGPAARFPSWATRPAAPAGPAAARWAGPSRRTVLQAGAALGTAAGMALLGVFPAARRAYADGYDIYGSCPAYASDHDCSPGCGPSTVFADACVTSGTDAGFHKSDGVTWTLRPNQCYSGSTTAGSGATRAPAAPARCHVERRCHDGYRRTGAGWVRSICRWTTDCGCPGAGRLADRPPRATPAPDVSTVQHLLNAPRCRASPRTVRSGRCTEAAVRSFQTGAGLPVTGAVDPRTWPALVVTVRRPATPEPRCGPRRCSSTSGATS